MPNNIFQKIVFFSFYKLEKRGKQGTAVRWWEAVDELCVGKFSAHG